MRPALDSNDNWLTAQSCRLYPEDDSLGCDYYEDSGIRQKGWLGYCLQYDRYPGSEDACVMWYPVDRVKGDGIEEGAGYVGEYPLYYSLGNLSEIGSENKVHFPYEDPQCVSYDLDDFVFSYPVNLLRPLLQKDSLDEIYFDCINRREDTHYGSDGIRWRLAPSNDWYVVSYEHGCDSRCIPSPYNTTYDFDSNDCGGCDRSNTPCCGGADPGGNCYQLAAYFDNSGYFSHIRWFGSDDSGDTSSNDCSINFVFSEAIPIATQGAYDNCMPTNDCGVSEPSCGALFSSWGGCCVPPLGTTIYTLDEPVYVYAGINSNTLSFSFDGRFGSMNTNISVGQTAAGPWVYLGSVDGLSGSYTFDLEQAGIIDLEWFQYIQLENTARQVCHGGGAFYPITVQGSREKSIVGQKVVRVVTPIGQNKYWSGRVYEGSDYAVPGFGYIYSADYRPFGRVVPPGDEIYELADPSTWDSKDDEAGKQPLYYEAPDTSLAEPYQPRVGQPHTTETVKRLFAKSYGTWRWDGSEYVRVEGYDWGPPDNWCPNNIRPKVDISNIETYTYDCTDVNIQICADNAHNTYFNGNFVGSAADWHIVTPYSIALIPGENVIAVQAIDWGVIYGVSVKINWTCSEPMPPVDTSSISDWKCTASPGSGWTDINYDDSSWSSAVQTTAAGPGYGNALDVPMIWAAGAGAGSTVYCRYTFNNETEISSEVEVTCNGGDCFDCPSPTCDYCGVKPLIFNMQAGGVADNYIIGGSGFVKFTFNSKIDVQQLPLVMYAVDWQDDDKTVVTGVEMRDRPNDDDPHVVYHAYSYWDLLSKAPASGGAITCSSDCSSYGVSGACCAVRPSVKVKDNWGWCNNGVDGEPCPLGGYQPYSGLIIVTR
ncbi:hypothetical protein DRH27_05105 [Candidatus Falkowbacteria bacterium]|nr:MAG: hypothetical protein DRH27_05105 [Candidatus Falkowbacteria bacterium]